MNRVCFNCNSDKTYTKKDGHEYWYRCDGNYCCHKCYMKLIISPKWNPIRNPMNSPKRLSFKGKSILLSENPRKGVCQWCGRTDCKTDMHHINYHDDDPLKDTVELCTSCHAYETWKKRLGS